MGTTTRGAEQTSDRGQTNFLVGLAFGALAPVVVSLILVPFRQELDNTNLALILVLVVVIAAILGGRGAGALAAVMATLSFEVQRRWENDIVNVLILEFYVQH